MKKTKRLNRGLALFLALMMSLMPVTVFADEEPSGEGGNPVIEAHQNNDSDALLQNTESKTSNTPPSGDGNEGEYDSVKAVQALINALPEEITVENAEEVRGQLEKIDEAKADLTDEQIEQLDTERYTEAANALSEQETEPALIEEDNTADENAGNVAKIGDTEYTTLQAAIEAAQSGDTVTLENDVKESIAIINGKDITLNIPTNVTLTNSDNQHTITVESRGTLTITGEGTVDNVSHQKAAIFNQQGNITLNGGTFTRSQEAGTSILNTDGSWVNSANDNSYYTILNRGTMEINSGVTVSQDGSFSSLIDTGWVKPDEAPENASATLTINGGTFDGGKISLKNDSYSTLTVKNGEFKNSSNWSVCNYGEMTIENGKFSSKRSALYNGKSTDEPGNLIVTGGTFNYSTGEGCVGISSTDKEHITLTGGTFSSDVNEYVANGMKWDPATNTIVEDKTVDSCVAKIGDSGYNTLKDAIIQAENGQTITLMKEVTENVTVTADKNIILDLNTNIIKGYLLNKGTLEIKATTGGVQNPGNYYAVCNNGISLKVTGGIYINTNTSGVFYNNAGKMELSNCTVTDKNIKIAIRIQGKNTETVINEGTYTGTMRSIYNLGGGDVTINNGTFTAPSLAIQSFGGKVTVEAGTVEATENGSVTAIEADAAEIVIKGGSVKALGQTKMNDKDQPLAPTAIALYNNPYNNDANSTSSNLTISGGTVEATGFAISGNNLRSAGTEVGINGNAQVKSNNFGAIYWPMEGTLNISENAQVTGATGIEAKMGTLNISGGTITGSGEYKDQPPMNGGSAPEGSALLLSTQMYGNVNTQYKTKPDLTVNITAGKLISTDGNAVTVYNTRKNEVPAEVKIAGTAVLTSATDKEAFTVKTAESNSDIKTTAAISGGTFNTPVLAEYCANGFMPKENNDGTYGVTETIYVAQVGDNKYSTLQEAVNAATGDNATVKLLNDVTGDGVKLLPTDQKNVTIDLNGHTYTVTGLVGSPGYESQGFHFEKNNTVTVKNGTVACDAVDSIVFQNYCNLTLENLTINGGANAQYGLSCNSGNTTLNNVNISGANSNFVALDVMHWHNNYTAPTLEINNTAENIINGKIDVYCYEGNQIINTCTDTARLTINSGTFSTDVSKYVASGKACIQQADDKYIVTDASALMGTVTAYGGGTVDATNSKNITVTFDSNQILVYAADGNSYGREPNKWWAGIHVIAPEGIDKSNAKYQKIKEWWNDDGTKEDWTDADTIQSDGQYWAMVTPVYMNQFKGDDNQLIYRYRFDWDVDGTYDQNVTIIVKDDVKFGDHGEHTWNDGEVTKEATCMEKGEKTFTCTIGGETKTEKIDALGHKEETIPGKPATCTETGLTDGTKCSVCGEVLTAQEEIPATGHKEEIIPGKPATCTETGLTAGSHCSVCGETLTAQEEIPALGHNMQEVAGTSTAPTCTTAGKAADRACSRCDHTETGGEIAALGHTPVVDPAVAATCTETGLSAGSHCSVCDEILTAQEEIPALGHTPVVDPAIPATLTTLGKTEGSHCEVCGTVLTAQEDVRFQPVVAITSNNATLSGAGTVTLTVTSTEGAAVTVTCDNTAITLTQNADGTYSAALPNANAGYTFTANIAATDTANAASASTTVNVTYYSSGGSGGGGGGGGGGGSSTPSVTPNNPPTTNIGENDTPLAESPNGDLTLTVDGTAADNIAKAEVKPEDIDNIVTKATDSTKNVTVNVKADNSGNGAVIDIPAASIAALGEKTGAALIVNTDAGSITISNSALSGIGSDTGNITITVTKANDSDIDVTVAKDGVPINTIAGGIKAVIPVASAAPGTVAILINEDGSESIFKKEVAANGSMTLSLDGSAKLKVTDNSKSFADTPNHWAKDAVDFVTARDLFQGVSENTFSPNGTMSRAMLVTVLHRLENMPAGGTSTFPDVAAGTWYTDAVAWAADNGIVTGTGAGFNPNGNITREQLAAILYRYAQTIGINTDQKGDLSSFSDNADVSDWAQDAMSWAVGAGLINGKTNGKLDPAGNTTRAEVAAILMRMCGYMAK